MAVRFKLDENFPRDAESSLREVGHDVHTAVAEHLGGNPDPKFFDAAQGESRVRVTFDLGFSQIEAGLGLRFTDAVAEATARALAFPLAGSPFCSGMRRVFRKDFPFSLADRLFP